MRSALAACTRRKNMLADSAIWGHRETFHLQTVSPLPLITLIIIVNIEEDMNYLNGMDFALDLSNWIFI